jgi:hypothetical protein
MIEAEYNEFLRRIQRNLAEMGRDTRKNPISGSTQRAKRWMGELQIAYNLQKMVFELMLANSVLIESSHKNMTDADRDKVLGLIDELYMVKLVLKEMKAE